MDEKKTNSERSLMGLPPLKIVLGDVPEPEPKYPFQRFGTDKPEEAKTTIEKLIGKVREH
jgi:hypothetical protein